MRTSGDPFRIVFTQAGGGATRAVRFVNEQPSWLARAVMLAVGIALTLVALVVIVPVVIIAITLFIVLALVGWVRAKLTRARKPNGPLDGRHNVRVITRTDP